MNQQDKNPTPSPESYPETSAPGREFSASELFQSLYLYKKWIALFTALCLIVTSVYALIVWLGEKDDDRYSCQASFAIQWSQEGMVVDPNDPSKIVDIQSAEYIVDSVLFMIESQKMLSMVESQTGLSISRSELSSALAIKPYEDTQMVSLSLVWNGDAEQTLSIMNAVLESLPVVMKDTLKNGTIAILDTANTPREVAILPNFRLILLVTAIALVAACAIAIAVGFFRTTVQSRDNITNYLSLETVGEIPRVPPEQTLLYDGESANFKYREAYRTCISILRHRMITEKIQSLYITSSMAHEGKSSLLLNIAQSFAEQEGYKVLLVDYDTRKPQIAKMLHIKTMGRTIHGVAQDKIDLADAIVHVTERFHVLCADTTGFQVLTDETVELFNDLRKDYDFIFFDTPPVGIISDAIRLNDCTDACLYAVKHNYVTTDIIKKALHIIRQSGHPIMGAVLNEVKSNPLSRYYYESHYRHYGYYSYDKSAEGDEKPGRIK